jgi:hypothetical protein
MTGQVAPTVEGRAQEVRRILDVDWGALKEKHLPYVTASLATHKPYGPLRMFVAAVQLCASEAYSELEPIIRNAISAEQAAMLTQHGHLTAAS